MPVRAPAKKAVLVGVCSKVANDLRKLPGALEDVKKLGNLLIDTFQYKKDDITIIVNTRAGRDELPDPKDLPTNLPLKLPTDQNILDAMRALVAGAERGDHIFFSYAGHGVQADPVKDKNETDEQDELLVPSNFQCGGTSGICSRYSHFIRDDQVREIFVDQLKKGVHCTLLFDCCHSGTACDLPEIQLDNGGAPGFTATETLDHKHAASHTKNDPNDLVSVKDVTSWAACSDAQLTYGGTQGGHFINAFVEILQSSDGKGIKYKDLLLKLRKKLKDVTDEANKRMASKASNESPPAEAPRPQLGSLRRERILGEVFTL